MITLFLDFDGVCHPKGRPAFDDHFSLSDPALTQWLPILENILEPYPDVEIVISAVWCRYFDEPTVSQLLGSLANRFAGSVQATGSSRADELLAEVASRRLQHWLALDDDISLKNGNECQFIVCDPTTGLSSQEVQQELRDKLSDLSQQMQL